MSDSAQAAALLEQLDEDQRAVARQATGPLVVRAGAGTGKTRAITYRIAYAIKTGVYGPHDVLAVTFTARAAAEMRERLAQLGVPEVQARTFHAAALRQLRYFWSTAIGGTPPEVLEHKAALVAAAAASIGISNDRAAVRDIAAEIEWTKVSLLPASKYAERVEELNRPTPAGISATDFERVITAYERVKNERRVIDFEDVILLLIGIFETRPDILAQVQNQYRHFVVDEYQDVSPMQQRLLELWLGDRKNLCVVGDAAQTIYSFTGASARYLLDFQKRFPSARTVELVRDYRSTPQVVSLANSLVEKMRLSKTLRLKAQRPMGPAVHYFSYSDDAEQARAVVKRIEKLHLEGTDFSDIAILYRTNSQSEDFITALSAAGISYQLRGGQEFFARKEIREAITMLRNMYGADPNVNLMDGVISTVSALGWTKEPTAARGAVRERWDALNALVELAQTKSSLGELIENLDERARAQFAPSVNGVTLSTIHAAKGLEWDAVFLIGVSQGLLPINQAKTAAEIEEELRLLYVAVTRAKVNLELSWARARTDRKPSRKVSQFLTDIWPRAERKERGANTPLPPAESRTMSARAVTREFLETAPAEVVERFSALRTWRAAQAKLLKRAAFQVFPDLTLREIAQMNPQDRAGLERVRGIGQVKLDQFGDAILAILDGADPQQVAHQVRDNLAEFDAGDFAT